MSSNKQKINFSYITNNDHKFTDVNDIPSEASFGHLLFTSKSLGDPNIWKSALCDLLDMNSIYLIFFMLCL